MELVTSHGEEEMANLLAVVEKDPAAWICVHVNISRLNQQKLEAESLTGKVLENIRESGMRMAQILLDSKLSEFEGRIFIFEDSDVIALFKKSPFSFLPVLEELRGDFIRHGLLEILSITDMQEKLADLVQLAQEKEQSAKLFRRRRYAVELGESIFQGVVPEPSLLQSIHDKRRSRTTGSVLLIDDDVVARSLLSLTLREKCRVIQARDAKAGVIAYIDQAPNMVFLDIHLPDHNGHEVLKRLKLIEPEAYVVMISGDTVPENVLSAKNLGVAGFIRKPFKKENILKYINLCPSLAPKKTS